ncbi:MAG: hypothetical protein ABR909_00055 [Candidatus Bathyarchaeia archaeon]
MSILMVGNVVRIYYWTIYASNAIIIPIDEALNYFNKFNDKEKRYSCRAPNTAIIAYAIGEKIRNDFENNASPWYNKLALCLIRKVWKQLV